MMLAKKASEKLNSLLEQNQNKPILFMTSGGSALILLDFINPLYISDKTTVTVLDERLQVSEENSNFTKLMETDFFGVAQVREAKFIEPKSGEQFDKALHDWKCAHPDGIVIVTMGIGPDGHTAGIFPGFEDDNSEIWAKEYEAKIESNKFPKRLTVTYSFLREIVDHAVIYAEGDNKKLAIEATLAKTGVLSKIPARIVLEMRDVGIFV